jgi:hypothetical protein
MVRYESRVMLNDLDTVIRVYSTTNDSSFYKLTFRIQEVPEFLLHRVLEYRTPYRVGRLCQRIPKMSQLRNSVVHDEIKRQNVIHLRDFMYKSRTTIYDLICR